ncbi:Membrane carboxypeptidase (penicillin-binding protein) [Agreia bicolorata]|uniref:Membrane carboxypeptidase (Penicillin-binding protein) n=2 Tax=Agreia bicolorata TaxID=110935 RepID=A0A1T4XWI9_9MICO|nr:Membrane carboxypeptidase (penicillin-binding protein) [Agreia bicolorata]
MSAQKSKVSGVIGAILGLVGMSAIAGVLVTAMVAPALAVTGIATNNSIGMFENLPSNIRPDVLAQKSEIYATGSDGNPVLLASVYDQNREQVGWDQISPFVKDAVVSVEDPRFYTHGGVDIISAARAAAQSAAGGDGPGASTISMQYVRNILIQKTEEIQDPAERKKAFDDATKTTVDRKLKEMKLAIGLEKEFTKDQILLGYLNISNFGGTVYGIEAAAQYYYGVSAKDVTLAQATSLVAMVNEPNGLRIDQPDSPEKIVDNQARRDVNILPAMLKEHKITQAQYDEAKATPVTPNIVQPSTGCTTANADIGAGFFCDYVSYIVKNDPVFGADADTRWQKFRTGGYKIYTTLDIDLQTAAITSMFEHVPKSASELDIGSSMVTVQPGTGRVLAMVQNKIFNPAEGAGPEETSINYSTDFDYGGSTGFASGSTYKAFTLAQWLKTGHSINERVNGSVQTFNLATFKNRCEGSGGGTYKSANDGGPTGSMTVATATANSVNNAFIAMAQKLDMCDITETAEAFGMHRADGAPMKQVVSSVLGINEVAPLTVAAAYAGIAAGGLFCKPIAIDQIVDSAGADVPIPPGECNQAVDPNVAATMAIPMQQVVTEGTATGARIGDGVPILGKTGTTDGEKHVWFAGASTKLATVIWVGNVVGDVSVRYTSVPGYGEVDNMRWPTWTQYMAAANQKYPGDAFPKADGSLTQTPQATVPSVQGKTIAEAQSLLEAAGFTFQDGGATDNEAPAGTAAGSVPAGGETVAKGSTVTVYTSNGALKSIPDVISGSNSLGDAANKLGQAGWKFAGTKYQVTGDGCNEQKPIGTEPAVGTFANPASQGVYVIGCKKK